MLGSNLLDTHLIDWLTCASAFSALNGVSNLMFPSTSCTSHCNGSVLLVNDTASFCFAPPHSCQAFVCLRPIILFSKLDLYHSVPILSILAFLQFLAKPLPLGRVALAAFPHAPPAAAFVWNCSILFSAPCCWHILSCSCSTSFNSCIQSVSSSPYSCQLLPVNFLFHGSCLCSSFLRTTAQLCFALFLSTW